MPIYGGSFPIQCLCFLLTHAIIYIHAVFSTLAAELGSLAALCNSIDLSDPVRNPLANSIVYIRRRIKMRINLFTRGLNQGCPRLSHRLVVHPSQPATHVRAQVLTVTG
jgi:hypothetical protein